MTEYFKKLNEISDTLLGPNGCPWDREQTLQSCRKYVLEETCEVIEAIDLGDKDHIKEELGDLFFNAIFLAKLAEKEDVCSMDEILQAIVEKLIRRHPHVFGDVELTETEAVLSQWEAIKKSEKKERIGLLDGISKALPVLVRAQKIIKRLQKASYPVSSEVNDKEEVLGVKLIGVITEALENDLDAEQALRRVLTNIEERFRKDESRI